ncbi:predicted protein [Histoplasma capsulatum G186AR]|uniref:Uncharacterized protein n=1 Tax=Ajellomyces capsulatus (strain G186AR / H82 / ATCC MYA-2454 / RMSCC 2432) TaxID=447093 RepID=C0NXD5_AJECG|nr:uncharacterized protein HCBG_08127 [Histoplasma capsulatum G186AR]EEH04001.1 predicted protein [Histoplasma capsulatum G186AR]
MCLRHQKSNVFPQLLHLPEYPETDPCSPLESYVAYLPLVNHWWEKRSAAFSTDLLRLELFLLFASKISFFGPSPRPDLKTPGIPQLCGAFPVGPWIQRHILQEPGSGGGGRGGEQQGQEQRPRRSVHLIAIQNYCANILGGRGSKALAMIIIFKNIVDK